jgi:hypothetical protein
VYRRLVILSLIEKLGEGQSSAVPEKARATTARGSGGNVTSAV